MSKQIIKQLKKKLENVEKQTVKNKNRIEARPTTKYVSNLKDSVTELEQSVTELSKRVEKLESWVEDPDDITDEYTK